MNQKSLTATFLFFSSHAKRSRKGRGSRSRCRRYARSPPISKRRRTSTAPSSRLPVGTVRTPRKSGQRIVRDFDRLAANGIFVVNLSPGRGEPKYLSPEHMDQVKFTVQEAAKRGMRLWIQDESDYPSGFAGGKISKQYPQLGMQGIVADIRVHVAARPDAHHARAAGHAGDLRDRRHPPTRSCRASIPIPVPANGQLKWTVPTRRLDPE